MISRSATVAAGCTARRTTGSTKVRSGGLLALHHGSVRLQSALAGRAMRRPRRKELLEQGFCGWASGGVRSKWWASTRETSSLQAGIVRSLSSSTSGSDGEGSSAQQGTLNEEELRKHIHPIVPKKLNELMIVDKLMDKTGDEITAIFDAYHATKKDCVSSSLTSEEWSLLCERVSKYPMFVFPVKKPDGAFFVLIAQWDVGGGDAKSELQYVLTFLDDYQRNPQTAIPYFHLVAYPELVQAKGKALVRAEFLSYVTKQEAQVLLHDVIQFFVRDEAKFEHVRTFNDHSNLFDFQKVFFE